MLRYVILLFDGGDNKAMQTQQNASVESTTFIAEDQKVQHPTTIEQCNNVLAERTMIL